MKFAEKNDGGIELHLSIKERELIFNALRHYSAYGKLSCIDNYISEICEITNVLHLPEFDKVK
ncbi:MAG: hypothetical protein E7568_05585 [Ruminococcaceae bacterium]|nr:hypothetical protein [Oscillospiraceae bacterium]